MFHVALRVDYSFTQEKITDAEVSSQERCGGAGVKDLILLQAAGGRRDEKKELGAIANLLTRWFWPPGCEQWEWLSCTYDLIVDVAK